MCPQAFDNVGERGVMDFSTFKKVIDQFPRKKKPNGIKLFWLGEPMLNKDFPKFLCYAAGHFMNPRGYEYITFDTNCCFMTEEVIETILEVGEIIPLFTTSLDAITPETYGKIRVGGDFEKVMGNVRAFIRRRHELKKNSPRIVLQFILMKENYKEAPQFIRYWSNFLKENPAPGNPFHQDIIWIKRMDSPFPEKQGECNQFFKEKTNELGISSKDLGFARLVATTTNNWNKDEL